MIFWLHIFSNSSIDKFNLLISLQILPRHLIIYVYVESGDQYEYVLMAIFVMFIFLDVFYQVTTQSISKLNLVFAGFDYNLSNQSEIRFLNRSLQWFVHHYQHLLKFCSQCGLDVFSYSSMGKFNVLISLQISPRHFVIYLLGLLINVVLISLQILPKHFVIYLLGLLINVVHLKPQK